MPGQERRASLTACVLLVVLTLLVFAPAILGGQFFYRDVSQNHYAMRSLDVAELSSGRLPLWNPHLTFGQPLLANPNYMVLHPTTLLFALLPFDTAFAWGIVLQYLLAAVGMFVLLRDQGLSRPAAWLAGVAFAFSGPLLSLGKWLTRRAVLRGRPLWYLAAAAVLAVEVIAGEPLMILATLVFGFLFAARGAARAGEGDVKEDDTPLAGRVVRMALVAGLAFLLAAPQILSTMELMPLSERGAGFGYELASKWSTHPLRLWEFLVPGWFGDPVSYQPLQWWGEGFFESTLPFLLGIYLGGPVLLLAWMGLCSVREQPLARLLGAGLLVSLLLALGRHVGLYGLLYDFLPGFDRFRYPSKFLLILAFCAAGLAGVGLDRLVRGASAALRRRLALGGAVLVGLPLAAWLTLTLWPAGGAKLLHGAMGAMGSPGGPRQDVVLPLMAWACLRAALITGAGWLLAWGIGTGALRRGRPVLLLCALVAADLYGANGHLNPVVDRAWYRETPALSRTIAEGEPRGRIYRHPRPDGFGLRFDPEAGDTSIGFQWDRLSLRNVTALQHGLYFGYDRNNERLNPGTSAFLSLRMEAEYSLEEKIRTWKLGSIRYVQSYQELHHPDLTLVTRSDTVHRPASTMEFETSHPLYLYQVESTLPRARMVGAAEFADRRDAALDRMRAVSFRPRDTVLLPGPAGTQAGGPGRAGATIVVDEPRAVEVLTDADFPGWLVLSDTFFPGWEARVDGEPAEILPGYLMFRAVAVPAGKHRVSFHYRPRPLRLGAGLSLLGLLGALLAAGWGWRDARRARR
jgi:hypothetical protein